MPELIKQRARLLAFDTALRREAHVVRRYPTLLWQQLYNRLQWEEDLVDTVLVSELAQRRKSADRSAWLNTRLPYRESQALVRIFQGHVGWIHACAFSPAGDRLLSGGADKLVRIWNTKTGVELKSLDRHALVVYGCAWSPDGTRFASASKDGTARVWDVDSYRSIILDAHDDYVSKCAFSPDGKCLVTASGDHTLRIWNTHTGCLLHRLSGHEAGVTDCTFSPDGKQIVSASSDKTLGIWDATTGHRVHVLEDHALAVETCAVSPDNELIVSGGGDRRLIFWERESGRKLSEVNVDGKMIRACAFSPDGVRVIFAVDRQLGLWDLQMSDAITTFVGHSAPIMDCVYSPDGTHVVTASQDGILSLWAVRKGEEAAFAGHSDAVSCCVFAPVGEHLVTTGDDGRLVLWNDASHEQQQTLEAHASTVSSCAFNSNGTRLVSSGWDKTVRVWDVSTGRMIRTFHGHTNRVRGCAYSPDGGYVASVSDDRTARLWNITTRCEAARLEPIGHLRASTHCTFSPEGSWLLTDDGNTLKIWDLETKEVLALLQGHDSYITACTFSNDGRRVLSASEDETLRVWDARNGDEMLKLQGHCDQVLACAFSPDDSTIASASRDRTLRLWDSASGRLLGILEGHVDSVTACVFSRDGNWLASASNDRSLRIWDVDSATELAAIILPSPLTALDAHAYRPIVAAGDSGGAVYVIELMDLASGPPRLTALDVGTGLRVDCPRCGHSIALESETLGDDVGCAYCSLQVQLNDFRVEVKAMNRDDILEWIGAERWEWIELKFGGLTTREIEERMYELFDREVTHNLAAAIHDELGPDAILSEETAQWLGYEITESPYKETTADRLRRMLDPTTWVYGLVLTMARWLGHDTVSVWSGTTDDWYIHHVDDTEVKRLVMGLGPGFTSKAEALRYLTRSHGRGSM